MIDWIFAWLVTRKFGLMLPAFSLSGSKYWLDLSLSFLFQGLLNICSEKTLIVRREEIDAYEATAGSLTPTTPVLIVCSLPVPYAFTANPERA